jgi:23S rRNA (uracil1939-C5)-methyltransferase
VELSSHFELVPQKLVYGGSALGHHEGRPVLVSGALPGERVAVEPLRQAKGVVHGRLLEVLTPSIERIEPPCPYFGRCGGCHYQHLAASRQLEVKQEILRETLRGIGHVDWPGEIITRAAEPWHYRNQVQLKIRPAADGRAALGFFEAESRRLVPVDACLISSLRLNGVIRELSQPDWTARLARYREVELRTDDRDEDVMMVLTGGVDDGSERLAQDCLSQLPGLVSVTVSPESESDAEEGGAEHRRPRGTRRRMEPVSPRVYGKPRIAYDVGAFRYEISPGSFFQSSRFLLPEFVDTVTGGDESSGSLALDLYAGVGLLTLPLARRFSQVVAVEENRTAAADLTRNAAAHQFGNVRAVAASAAEFLRRYALAPPELVVLDPPRAGAEASVLRRLTELAPERIHYASCNPPTLARDLSYLLGCAYRLESLELFDFFPQTFHLETVAKLSRARGSK